MACLACWHALKKSQGSCEAYANQRCLVASVAQSFGPQSRHGPQSVGCLDVLMSLRTALRNKCVVTVLWCSADNVAIHFQVKFEGKFQQSWQRSFELRKLRKPLVPEEMSNPAGSSDIAILDMYMGAGAVLKTGPFFGPTEIVGFEKAWRWYSFEKISFSHSHHSCHSRCSHVRWTFP